jgi:hypothetical protein
MSGAAQGLIGSLKGVSAAPTPSMTGTLTGTYTRGVDYTGIDAIPASGSNFTSASVTTGSIPTGMTFTYLANTAIYLNGTATTDGSYSFTVTLVNNPGGGLTQTSQAFSFVSTIVAPTLKRCTSFQISIGCCTNTSQCGPFGAGVSCATQTNPGPNSPNACQ